MNRLERRARERADRKRQAKLSAVLAQLDDYARRQIDLARTKDPRAAADDLYEAARHYRREAQAARNRGDEDACQRVLAQAEALEDAAGAFVADL